MKYIVIYEKSADGGWGACVPDIPGCFTLADTRDEAASFIREAVAGHVQLMRDRGQTIPMPTTVVDSIEVA
jgi:predicted RNase H-like HicB family nuclease